MFEQFTSMITNNQLASAGMLTVITGSILAYCRSFPSKIYQLFLLYFTTELDLKNGSSAYYWTNYWFSGLETTKYGKFEIDVMRDDIKYTIADGTYWRWYNNRLVIVNKYRKKSDDNREQEWISLRFFATKKITSQFLAEIKKNADATEFSYISVNVNNGGCWRNLTSRPINISEPILEKDTFRHIVDDAEQFVKSENLYNERGLVYKRGYIFSGPPGNGKTTTIAAMAARLKRHIYHICLNNITSQQFIELISYISPASLLILEDIDCIKSVKSRIDCQSDNEKPLPLDMSTILNVLDGNLTPHGLMFVMTTNHKDKLDPALLRPGRTDVHVEINGPNQDKVKRLYNRLMGTNEGFEEFAKYEFTSMAEAQNKILELKGTYVVST